MEDNNLKVKNLVTAIENFEQGNHNDYGQVINAFAQISPYTVQTADVKAILRTINNKDNYENKGFAKSLLAICANGSIDAEALKMLFNGGYALFDNSYLNKDTLLSFLNVCSKNSLNKENLEMFYGVCDKKLLECEDIIGEINSNLNEETARKNFEMLRLFHFVSQYKIFGISEQCNENLKKRGIVEIVIGGVFELGAIAFVASWLFGLVALATMPVALIAAPIAVLGLASLILSIFAFKEYKENKKSIEDIKTYNNKLEEHYFELKVQKKDKDLDDTEKNEKAEGNNLSDSVMPPVKSHGKTL